MEVVRTLAVNNAADRAAGSSAWIRQLDQEPPFQFFQLLQLMRRRLVVLVLAATCGAALVFGAATYVRKYSAKTLVLVEPLTGAAATGTAGAASSDEQTVIETHILTMLSPANLSKTVASLSNGDRGPTRPIDLRGLEDGLKIQQELHSRVISVVYMARNPLDAALIANRVADLYVAEQRGKMRDGLKQRLVRAHERVAALQASGDVSDPEQAGAANALGSGAETRRRLAEALILESTLRRQLDTADREDLSSANISVMSPAVAPDHPSTGSPAVLAVPGAVAFAILGLFWCLVLERGDRSLRCADDIEQALGVPCAGLVPRLLRAGCAKTLMKRLTDLPGGPFAEAIRTLLFDHVMRTDDHATTLLVTSAVEREGKDTLAVALATGAALLHRRTLLIDVDWRSRKGAGSAHGLLRLDDPEAGAVSPFEVEVVPTLRFHRLTLVAAGKDPSGMLIGQGFADLIMRLRDSYHVIIIQGPSVLNGAEASSLARVADKVLLAVSWGRTRRDFVSNALLSLAARHNPRCSALDRVSVVLTGVRLHRHALYRFGDRAEFLSRR